MLNICRPDYITCRWIKEISEAIENICPLQPRIDKCSSNPNKDWNKYYNNLKKNPCINNSLIQQILNYDVDYNEYRRKKRLYIFPENNFE